MSRKTRTEVMNSLTVSNAALSNTKSWSKSASTNASLTATATGSLSHPLVSPSVSLWDCTALGTSDIFIGLGNATTALIDANNTTEVQAAFITSAGPPLNPTRISSADSPVKNSIVIKVQPLDRRRLIDSPIALILNVTVVSPFPLYWSLENVAPNGQSLIWQSVAAITGSWHHVTLQPPSGGWFAGLLVASPTLTKCSVLPSR